MVRPGSTWCCELGRTGCSAGLENPLPADQMLCRTTGHPLSECNEDTEGGYMCRKMGHSPACLACYTKPKEG